MHTPVNFDSLVRVRSGFCPSMTFTLSSGLTWVGCKSGLHRTEKNKRCDISDTVI